MATTSPDGLYSPNEDTPVDFVADWAASMSSVQTALTNRGVKTGTSAQRTAATGVREGTLWYDTTTQSLWAYLSGTWVSAGPSYTGTVVGSGIVTAASGVTVASSRFIRVGNQITMQISATGTFAGSGVSNSVLTVSSDWRPATTAVGTAWFSSSGFQAGVARINTSGVVQVWKEGSGNRGSVEFNITYIHP